MHLRRLFWGIAAALLTASAAHAQARTVAVVFDDSGSMGNPANPSAAWRDASYALQILTGLLAPRDALTVVRMSAPTVPVTVDLRSQAREIDRIRAEPHKAKDTPYEAVQTAMQALAQVARDEAARGEQTEKWLIIITDGQFFDELPPDAERYLRAEIRAFVQETGARTVLLLIGDIRSDISAMWEEEAQARTYEAPDHAEIEGQMRRIAADITSRSDQPLPVTVKEDRATLVTEFPLRRVTVLQQRPDAGQLAELRDARVGRQELTWPKPALEPGMPPGSSDRVFGRIHHVQRGARPEEVIPDGTVALTFDRPLSSSGTMQLLPEVAARLAVELASAEGNPLRPRGTVHEVCEGEPFRVRATLLSPAGDTVVRQVRDPRQFRVEARFGTQSAPLAAPPGAAYFERTLRAASGDAAVSVSAAYPGYFHFRSQLLTVRGVECRPRALGFAPVPAWTAKVTELDDARPVDLAPTADGAPVAPDELARWSLRRTDERRLKVDIERTPAGWRLRPKKTWGLACCTPTGTIPVTLEARSPNPREPAVTTTVELRIEDVGFWRKCGWMVLLALAIILTIVYVVLLMRKRRFCPGSEIVYQRVGRAASSREFTHGLPGKSFLVRWLVPTKAEKTAIEGITFEAGTRCGHIFLPPEAQSEDMYVAGERVEDPGRRPLRIAQGDTVEVRRGGSKEIYTYHLR